MDDGLLVLLCHAPTAATRVAAFPRDEPLDEPGRAAASRFRPPPRLLATRTSPARAARDTAAALGLHAVPDPALRDLDHGTWAGRTLEAVAADDPAGLAAWFEDPAAAPHGGESVAALIGRVAAWMAALPPGRFLAVTHATVLRAAVLSALGAPASAFWRVEAGPMHALRLRRRPGRWVLALG